MVANESLKTKEKSSWVIPKVVTVAYGNGRLGELFIAKFKSQTAQTGFHIDCKTVGFFLKISKEIGKAWRKSLTRAKRTSHTRP